MFISHALHIRSRLLCSCAALLIFAGCAANRSTNYPAARGFKLENSDPKAVRLVDDNIVVQVLTPRAIVKTLAAGYRPAIHPTAFSVR